MNDLLDIWGSQKALAEDLGLPASTVGSWARRGIPPRRYADLIRAAKGRGVEIKFEHLAGLEPFPDLPPANKEDTAA